MSDLDDALQLADAADRVTMSHYLDPALQVRQKADDTPVSEADTMTERTLRDMLAHTHPEDRILGEELGGDRLAHPGREWIIDPIDGTANYIRGVPVWATLVALAVDGVVTVGVASAPAVGRRWWAQAGGGAWVQDVRGGDPRRIHVSDVDDLTSAYLSYNGFSYWQEAGKQDALLRLIAHTGRNRAFGDFWGYMLVAEGAIDLAGEWGLAPYDMAAVDIIVREAGGTFTGMDGIPGVWQGSALASNGRIHQAACDVIAAE